MNAAELRPFVDRVYYIETVNRFFDLEEADLNLRELKQALRVLKDAARTIALPILEADPEVRSILRNGIERWFAVPVTERTSEYQESLIDDMLALLIPDYESVES